MIDFCSSLSSGGRGPGRGYGGALFRLIPPSPLAGEGRGEGERRSLMSRGTIVRGGQVG